MKYVVGLIMCAVIAVSGGGISRSCQFDGDCIYSNNQARNSVFLRCKGRQCQCKVPNTPIMDVPTYSMDVVKGECLVNGKAPCGDSSGISLGCKPGRSCVEGRCRRPSEVRSTPAHLACSEDIDCIEGYACKLKRGSFPLMYFCGKT